MKGLKKTLVPLLGTIAAVSLASCGISHTGEPNNGITKNEDGTYTVRVGNTNGEASAYAAVFAPMGYGMRAYAWYYGEHENGGKVKLDFIHRDDGLSADVRATHTSTLIEQDKVFGFAYSYADQYNAIDKANKVEVYTPMTQQYYQEEGDPVASFPVQPIDVVEGKQLVASAFAKGEAGLGASKVGVIAGTNAVGTDVLKGIRDEAKVLKKAEGTDLFVTTPTNAADTDYTASITSLKNAGVEVIILTDCVLDSVFKAIVAADWKNVKVLASYRFSNALYFGYAYADHLLEDGRRLFTTGWIAAGVQNPETYDEWAKYVEVLTLYSKHMNDGLLVTPDTDLTAPEVVRELQGKYAWAADGVNAYFYNSYTMAGYEATYCFAEGITHLFNDNLLDGASTEDYVAEMEKHGMHIPMSTVDVELKNGKRTGARAMTLVECTVENHSLGEPFRTFYDIPALEKAAK